MGTATQFGNQLCRPGRDEGQAQNPGHTSRHCKPQKVTVIESDILAPVGETVCNPGVSLVSHTEVVELSQETGVPYSIEIILDRS